MKQKILGNLLKAGGICTALIALVGNAAHAREPGVPFSVPPGNTIGVPIGANPPPGHYLNIYNGYHTLELKDSEGDDVGLEINVADTALHYIYVPGTKLLGGTYRAWVLQSFLNVGQESSIGAIPSGSEFNLGNTQIAPIGISWEVAEGQFVSADLSFIAPTGKWVENDPVNTAGNFWTFAPSVGYSYLKDGWNAAAHLQYFTNTENKTNNYKSGDEIMLNLTALKSFGDFSFGPVGYYRKQISSDENNGTAFGGTIAGKAELLGLGVGFSKRFGNTSVSLKLTHDVIAENTPGGTGLRVDFSIPLGAE